MNNTIDAEPHSETKVLRCYVRPEGKHIVAICVDLNMYATGDSVDEAKRRLHEHIQNAFDVAHEHGSVHQFLNQGASPTMLRQYEKTMKMYQRIITVVELASKVVSLFRLIDSTISSYLYTEAPEAFCPV